MATATESTPLKNAEAEEKQGSWLLGMTRAQLRLLRSPERGEPYGCLGLFAPKHAFQLLGQGSACHVRILMDCVYLSIPCVALAIPLRTMQQDASRKMEAGTAGAWKELDFVQAFCDMGLISLFLAFFHFLGLYLMNTAQDSVHTTIADREESVRQLAVTGGLKIEEALERASERERSQPRREGDRSPQLMSMTNRLLMAHVESELWTDEMLKYHNPSEQLEHAYAVEGCSVVISGFGTGVRLPEAIVRAVAEAAGAMPAYAVQPMQCAAFDRARRTLGERAAAGTVRWRKRAGGVTDTSTLLGYAFLTFKSSEQKSRVLLAAKRGTLLPPGHGPADGVRVEPGPNPNDVMWRSLEATHAERRCPPPP